MKNIFMSKPSITSVERRYIRELLDSGEEDLSQGSWVETLESRLADLLHVGSEQVIVVSSGTAALHLAFEILKHHFPERLTPFKFTMPAMTFISTGNAALMAGAKVEFVDIDSHTWNTTSSDLSVDLFGNPAGYNCLVEDAAEALGSHSSKPCGTFGLISILSFFANKVITTGGEGGALICHALTHQRLAFLLRQQGKDYSMPHHEMFGYNYRMTEMQAAFGCAQLTHLKREVERKRKIFEAYFERLKRICEFQWENGYSNRWLTVVKLPSVEVKKKVVEAFQANKIPWRDPFYPLYYYPWFESKVKNLPETEDLYRRGICLPSSFKGDFKPKVKFICDVVENCSSTL